MSVTILEGDALRILATLPAESVNCCVTSPPFLWLRDYGIPATEWPAVTFRPMSGVPEVMVPGESAVLGLESGPLAYIGHLVMIFRAVWRVLRKDGTCWIEIGDGWVNGGGAGYQGLTGERADRRHTQTNLQVSGGAGPRIGKGSDFCEIRSPRRDLQRKVADGLKPKDLIGTPWRLALALQADGWYLRQEIVWHKRNPMPESCKDRPTRAHSTILFLTKSERYWYDAAAISEECSADTHARYARGRSAEHKYADGGPGGQTIARTFEHMPGVNPKARRPRGWQKGKGAHDAVPKGAYPRVKQNASMSAAISKAIVGRRNSRSVWSVAIRGSTKRHYATFTAEIPRRCILAGCPAGGVVLDPFGGSGTTAAVAEMEGRNSVVVELKPEYVAMIREAVAEQGLFCSAARGAAATERVHQESGREETR